MQDKATTRGIGAAALLLAASQLVSRLLGYGREVLLAYQIGAGAETDAYVAAFTIPDWLNYMLAGSAFSLALVPMYAQRREEQGEAAADRFFGVVLGTVTLVAAVLTAVLWIAADHIVAWVFSEFAPATQARTAHLMRIMLPAQLCFISGGIIKAVLLARGRFLAAALPPLIYNAGIILGGVLLGPSLGVEGFAWGVLAGAFAGPLLVPILDARRRVQWHFHIAPLHRDFLRYLWLAVPVMLGVTMFTVNEWYDRIFGAALAPGTVAHLNYARKLMLAPVALVGQSIATASLPALAQLWAEKRIDELNASLRTTLQATLAIGVIMAAGLVVFAEPLTILLYEHGAFSAKDTAVVALQVAIMALSVPAWVAQQVASRAFYARGDTWRPMLLGTIIAITAVPLYLWLRPVFGIAGLALAGTLAMTANALATIALAHRLHGEPCTRPLIGALLRSSVVAAAAALPAYLLVRFLDLSPRPLDALASAAAGGIAFSALTALGLARLGDEATRAILRRPLARLGIKIPAA